VLEQDPLLQGVDPQTLPAGEPVPCQHTPALTPAHATRLRKLFSYGRPVHLPELGGIDLDLMVHGFLEVVDNGRNTSALVRPTRRGLAHISDARQVLIQAQRSHHELGHRLAVHLRTQGFHTWENIEFCNPDTSSSIKAWGVVRPDVFACLPSLKARNAAPAIYEVKVSRSDFLADLAKPQKRAAYADLAEAVYYVCADGLISKTELPDGFGLLCETDPGVFVLKKRAKRAKGFVLATDTAMTLMVKRQVPLGQLD